MRGQHRQARRGRHVGGVEGCKTGGAPKARCGGVEGWWWPGGVDGRRAAEVGGRKDGGVRKVEEWRGGRAIGHRPLVTGHWSTAPGHRPPVTGTGTGHRHRSQAACN
eukprot:363994-Chlamydomonas_euryale.AAC.5